MSNAFSGIKFDLSSVPVDAPEADRMRVLIETLSAYIEYFHGGSVKMESYRDGVLKIKMAGACLGCPLSAETLRMAGWKARSSNSSRSAKCCGCVTLQNSRPLRQFH